jgi:hypothetical protein
MKALHIMLISIGLFFVSCADLKNDYQIELKKQMNK